MKEKNAFIFFNCDEAKSQTSMNVFYNQTIYHDTKKARKLLLEKVTAELSAGRIHIESGDLEAVHDAILTGDPTAATDCIKFGAIARFPIV